MATVPLQPPMITPTGLYSFPERGTQSFRKVGRISTIEAMVKVQKKLVAFRPRTINFGIITDPRLRVIKPMPVHLSKKSGSVVAHFNEVEEFGCGTGMSAALDDLSKSLAELYFRFKADEDRLGPDMKRLWGKLSEYLEERTSR